MKDRPKPVPCDAHRLQKRRVPTISIEKRRGLIELFVSYPEAAGYRAGYVATTTRPPAGHFDARASPRQERSPTARMSTLLQGERWGCCRAEVIWISASIKRPTRIADCHSRFDRTRSPTRPSAPQGTCRHGARRAEATYPLQSSQTAAFIAR